MRLNEKILFSLLLLFVIIVGTLVFSFSFYLKGYEKLDEKEATSSLHNALQSLNASREGQVRILADWAAWDDTYDFIQDPDDPVFIESNLGTVTMENLDTDIFVITDLDGNIVWGHMYDRANNSLSPLTEEIRSRVFAIGRLTDGERQNETVSGIVMLPAGPMVIGSAPVTHSDGSGPVIGRFMIGTYLDAAHIAQAASVSSPTLAFIPVDDSRISPGIQSALLAGSPSALVITTRNSTALSTYVLIDDIYGNPALVATADTPREYYLQAESTLFGGFLILLAVIALVGSLVFILIDRYVLRRLSILRDAADEIRRGGTLAANVKVGGDDELTDVAVAFNQMIRTIDEGQKDIAESRQYLDRIFSSVNAGIVIIDAQTHRITDINPTAVSMIGLLREEIVGVSCHRFFCPAQSGECPVADHKENLDNTESVLTRPGGSQVTVIRSVIRLNIRGRDCLLETFIDHSERKRIEHALRESKEQFRNLAENTADVLFTLDRDGRITYVSPQVSRYGFTPEELKGRSFVSLVHPQDRREIAGNFTKEMETGENFTSTFRIIDRNGSTFWVEERSNILYDGWKNSLGIQGVIRDITDRKRAEDAIRLANRKLNLMNDITRHDIINTLTGLLGTVDMAMDPSQESNRDLFLADIRQLAVTIQKQIEFTREYQAVGVKEPVWQDLSRIIRHAAELNAGSEVAVINEIDAFEVFADPLLEKVVYNLIQNALSYGEHVRTIRFTEEISDRGFAVICEDDGIGIPDEMKEKIFERGIGRNTGMGLFLSREILAITGITIQEKGIYGKGARFEMILPKGGYRFPSEKRG